MTIIIWFILVLMICIALNSYSIEKEVQELQHEIIKPLTLDLTIPSATQIEFQEHTKLYAAAIDNWYKTIEAENDQIKARKTGRILQGTTKTPTKRTKKKRSRNKATTKGIRVPAKQKSKKR